MAVEIGRGEIRGLGTPPGKNGPRVCGSEAPSCAEGRGCVRQVAGKGAGLREGGRFGAPLSRMATDRENILKKKRHKFIDPMKARAAAQGGLLNYSYPQSEKRCAMCDQLRYSVDATGVCGPCRVDKYDRKRGAPNG